MMSVLEWKNVELFELRSVNSSGLETIKADITAHCCNFTKTINNTLTSSTTVLCDLDGFVHVIFENDNLRTTSFKCPNSQKPVKLCALTTNHLLTLITQDDADIFSFRIEVYDLKNLMKKEKHACCISTELIRSTSAATFLQAEFMGDQNPNAIFAIGIGFEKGDLLLHFGKISSKIVLNFRRHIIGTGSINGIQFEGNSMVSDIKTYNMFVTCLDGIYCLALNDKGSVEFKSVLDTNKNVDNHCSTISQPIGSESFLVAGRDDAIYCFTRDGDGRGPCYAIGGTKKFISWIGHYLIVVVNTSSDSLVICVDVENKLIVFHQRIKNLICVGSGKGRNSYYIITKAEALNIFMLQEHNTATKVQRLLAKSMYDNTLRLLERSGNANSRNTSYVRLKFGNNLLMRGAVSSAVEEFERTIGLIKPYDIISKLLYSRHNNNLNRYLRNLLKTNHNRTVEQIKLHERCFHRESLGLRIQQFWSSRSHFCDFQQLLVHDNPFLSLVNAQSKSENLISIFQNTEEKEILHFFQEHGREFLAMNSSMLLETLKTLVQNCKIQNILPYLIIFSDLDEFCINLLVDFSKEQINSDEGLHYYKLLHYLSLWRDKKISSQTIHKYLKQTPLRLNNTLIICKAFFFKIEPNNPINDDTDQATITCLDKNLKKSKSVAPLLSFPGTKVLYLRNLMVNKLFQNREEAKTDLELIEELRETIQSTHILLSQFTSNPIEFRNSCCDQCRQSLHMPSVYFLCQHSFHMDCIRCNYDTKNCFICDKNIKCNSFINYDKIDSIIPCDIIEEVSNLFASGLVGLKDCKNVSDKVNDKIYNCDPFINNFKNNYKNPFEENYDSNFNCF
ncbi:uncharacterized protein LOC132797661 [Drosophila nasuta]|uniref:uncharacterized protein LOC132797661 n=1 Tax=Drosophila nasuta TaxID=42062 RepID=UPI00295ED631|nr:uncharacterized protein LOC132797661 [Drosophila nasuta]